MPELRLHSDQIAGLHAVADRLPASCRWQIVDNYPVDMPCLQVGDLEIVYAVGGYDGWYYDRGGRQHLGDTDMSEEVAASWLQP